MSNRGLGTLTLSLIAQMGGFEQGLDRAARHTDKRMTQIEKRAQAMGKALGQALTVGAGIAITGLGLYVKNSIEAEKAQAQLAARIKDTFGAAGRSIEQLNAQADKLQGLTVFDDEAIAGVQAMLLTFKQINGTNFDDATAAVLDLATAMGTDANAAALQLGKALNDPIKGITALGRAGIQFTDDQKKLVKSLVEVGDVAGAQRVILDELAGQMGTAAEAARNTLSGALQALKNSFDNLLEGDVQDGGLRGTRSAIEDLNASLNDPGLKRGVDTMVEGMLSIANGAITATGKIGGLIADYKKLLADQGFLPTDANSSEKDLLARRDKLQGMVDRMGTGRTIWGDDTEKKLRQQINAINGQLGSESMPDWLKIPALNGGSSFSAIGFSAIGQSPSRQASTATGGKGAAGGRSAAAKATKELTDAQKAFNEQEEIYALIAEQTEQFRRDRIADEYSLAKAAEESIAQVDEQIAGMEFELSLLGLSNLEREKEIALRYAGANATDEQRARLVELTEQMAATREEVALMDDLKAGLSDMFTGFVSGAKSAKEAFGDFADNLFATALQFVADEAINAMFEAFRGGPKQANGYPELTSSNNFGQSGGGWAGFFSSMMGMFGGGRANGGAVYPGMLHPVNERGPELLSISGKDYLMMGANAGRITPNHQLGGGGVNVTNQFTLAAPTERRTQEQIAGRIAFETNRATSRNR